MTRRPCSGDVKGRKNLGDWKVHSVMLAHWSILNQRYQLMKKKHWLYLNVIHKSHFFICKLFNLFGQFWPDMYMYVHISIVLGTVERILPLSFYCRQQKSFHWTGLLTGCGKKRKLCGFWEANCAVKNGDCAGIVQDCAIV